MCLQLLVALQEAYGLGGGMLSVLSFPGGLHSGNAGFKFFGLSNQFVDQAVNAVRQKLDRLESLFVGFGKVNDVSVNRFVAGEATGIKDRSLQIVDVERCDFFGKFGLAYAAICGGGFYFLLFAHSFWLLYSYLRTIIALILYVVKRLLNVINDTLKNFYENLYKTLDNIKQMLYNVKCKGNLIKIFWRYLLWKTNY